MDIILSIYPKNVEKIESGIKKYEFRRSIYKNQDVENAYIYALAPMKKIVGVFKIGHVVSGTPEEVWERCGTVSGTTKESLMEYFKGKDTVYALEIINYKKFEVPIEPRDYIEDFYPPQFFRYLEDSKSLFFI
jgi:predicted transcriptional regulator